MGTLLLVLGVSALVLGGLAWLATAGFRQGDRPLDAIVSAELRDAGQPDEPRPVVVAEVRNPSASPVMVGLSARPVRIPGWLGASALDFVAEMVPSSGGISVPRRTARPALRAGQYETVGVVPERGTVRLTVPVPTAGSRYWLTAVIGQSGGRLRVHHIRVDGQTRLWLPVADLTGWRRD